MEIVYKDESYAIMGACFEVYKHVGPGFLEPVYQECLAIEFAARGIPFVAKEWLQIAYKGQPLEQRYQVDFLVYGLIVVELKAASSLVDARRAQLHNDLRAGDWRLGLLVNFGQAPRLEYERIVA
jgi:GxxExxY protein